MAKLLEGHPYGGGKELKETTMDYHQDFDSREEEENAEGRERTALGDKYMQVKKVVKHDKKSKEEIQEEAGRGKDAAILRLCQAADKERAYHRPAKGCWRQYGIGGGLAESYIQGCVTREDTDRVAEPDVKRYRRELQSVDLGIKQVKKVARFKAD